MWFQLMESEEKEKSHFFHSLAMNKSLQRIFSQPPGKRDFTVGLHHVGYSVGYNLEYRFRKREEWSHRGHLKCCCIWQGFVRARIILGSGGMDGPCSSGPHHGERVHK